MISKENLRNLLDSFIDETLTEREKRGYEELTALHELTKEMDSLKIMLDDMIRENNLVQEKKNNNASGNSSNLYSMTEASEVRRKSKVELTSNTKKETEENLEKPTKTLKSMKTVANFNSESKTARNAEKNGRSAQTDKSVPRKSNYMLTEESGSKGKNL